MDAVEFRRLVIFIATEAHKGQYRRDGVTPYIRHPEAVAARLEAKYPHEQEVVAAGWLHDVLEDSKLKREDLLRAGIPLAVVEAVEALTHPSGEPYKEALRRAKANPIARKVKVEDMLSNLSDAPTDRQIVKYAKGLLFLME